MKVVWSDRALKSLAKTHSYISRDSEKRAHEVVDRILRRGDQLGAFPYSGRISPVPGLNVREIVENPYRIIYRVKDDAVEVIEVLHGARRPRVKKESIKGDLELLRPTVHEVSERPKSRRKKLTRLDQATEKIRDTALIGFGSLGVTGTCRLADSCWGGLTAAGPELGAPTLSPAPVPGGPATAAPLPADPDGVVCASADSAVAVPAGGGGLVESDACAALSDSASFSSSCWNDLVNSAK